jgi:hypothetical protein
MTTQTLTARALAAPFFYEVVAEQVGITVATNVATGQPSRMCVPVSGEYDVQFSAQPLLTAGVGSTSDNVQIWIAVNGVDVADSNVKIQMDGGRNIFRVPAWNWFVPLAAGDCVEIYWWYQAALGDTIVMVSLPPAAAVPGTSPALPGLPSIIVTVDLVG